MGTPLQAQANTQIDSLTGTPGEAVTGTTWASLNLPGGEEGPTGDLGLAPQVLQFTGYTTSSGGSGAFQVRWYDTKNATMVRVQAFTVTVLTTRTNLAGSGGNYLLSFESTLDGTNKCDALPNGKTIVCYAGFTGFTTMDNATLYSTWTRCI